MKKIPLNKGKFAIVDDEDYEWISQRHWHLAKIGYAMWATHSSKKKTGVRKEIRQYLHRVIMNPSKGMEVDHINGDRLDNRKCNLRIATHAQNLANRPAPRNSTSGVKGVRWDKERSKWMAKITINYKGIFLGRYDNIEEATEAYNRASLKYFKEFAYINPT